MRGGQSCETALTIPEPLGAERELAAIGVPLADDPRGTGHVRAAGEQRCHVVLAQPQCGREGEPGVDGQGGGDRGDHPSDEHPGQDADREGGQRPGGERDPEQVEQVFASAFIGLVVYSDGWGENFSTVGLASGKLSFFLRNGIPVIVNSIPALE